MDAKTFISRGDHLLSIKRYEQALEEYGKALDESPGDYIPLCKRAVCYVMLGKYVEAIKEARKALTKKPDGDYAFYMVALASNKINDDFTAREYILKAIAIDSSNASYHACLADTYISEKNWQKVLENANKGLSLEPENVNCHISRCGALAQLKRKEEFFKAAAKTLELAPDNDHAHIIVGTGYSIFKNLDKAKEHFQQALAINPNSQVAQTKLFTSEFLISQQGTDYIIWAKLIGFILGFIIIIGKCAAG